MKSWMPWVLVTALAAAVGFAFFSSPPVREPEPIAAAPTAPREPAGAGAGLGEALAEEEEEPQGAPAHGARGEPAGEDATLAGVVREHLDVSQYTYLRLATDAGEAWAAVYRAPVKEGQAVVVQHATQLHGFRSSELKRDFDTIWFGVLEGHAEAPPLATAVASSPRPAKGKPAVGGETSIADLARRASALEGTEVTVTGRVVKENDGILGKNWIHVQDGSGRAEDGTNDVLVTTDATAKVGQTIAVTGTVRTNQDFGSGYAYKFMIEKASLRYEQ
jgi:hypothetical protein